MPLVIALSFQSVQAGSQERRASSRASRLASDCVGGGPTIQEKDSRAGNCTYRPAGQTPKPAYLNILISGVLSDIRTAPPTLIGQEMHFPRPCPGGRAPCHSTYVHTITGTLLLTHTVNARPKKGSPTLPGQASQKRLAASRTSPGATVWNRVPAVGPLETDLGGLPQRWDGWAQSPRAYVRSPSLRREPSSRASEEGGPCSWRWPLAGRCLSD